MSDIGGGNSAFDRWFFEIEIWGALLVLVCTIPLLAWRGSGHRSSSWPAGLLVVAALVLGPGIAVFWQVAYPPANGIEGAGRLLFAGPATLGNALLAGLGAFFLLERRVRWVALAPVAMVIGFWVLFLS